jgi:hypothetical protein
MEELQKELQKKPKRKKDQRVLRIPKEDSEKNEKAALVETVKNLQAQLTQIEMGQKKAEENHRLEKEKRRVQKREDEFIKIVQLTAYNLLFGNK